VAEGEAIDCVVRFVFFGAVVEEAPYKPTLSEFVSDEIQGSLIVEAEIG